MPRSSDNRDALRRLAGEAGVLIAALENQQAAELLFDLLDPEVADVLRDLEVDARVVAFRFFDRERQASIFSHLEHDEQQELVESITSEQVAQLLNEMEPDDRVDFLEVAPDELINQLLALMRPEERAETQRILDYPEESVGRDMTPEYVTVRPEWSIRQVLEHIRIVGRDAEMLNVLYVVDSAGHLINHVRLRRLLIAEPMAPCGEFVEGHVVSLRATEDREEAVRVMERYDVPVLPVVDDQNVLLGIITFDDVADVAEEEFTEDIQKMGGMAALEEPYVSVSVPHLVRKRVGWLIILFFGGILTVAAMGAFEESIKRFAILAMFVPLIIASGGNCGSQAASLMIRSLALGELTPSNWWMVFRRELVSGLMMGVVLGVLGVVAGTVATLLLFGESSSLETALPFGYAIGLSMVGVVLIGTLTGSMLPFLLQRLGFDPATSSTPFVATIVDVAGLIIYFLSANMILPATT
jgi:magnesium transporter